MKLALRFLLFALLGILLVVAASTALEFGRELDVFDTAWVYDHFYPLRTGPEEPTLEGWTCLAMLLARTRRLRGGVMVTGIPYRHPAVLAKMAVTVDIASGGRLELGLGAGWFEPECEAYGIELGPIGERFDRFDQALTIIRSLLTRPTTAVEGTMSGNRSRGSPAAAKSSSDHVRAPWSYALVLEASDGSVPNTPVSR